MSTPKKRFIAGAICPACTQMDRIQMWDVTGIAHRTCVACGFADQLNAEGISVPMEPVTRVTKKSEPVQQGSVQTLRFFPKPNNHSV